MSNRDVDQYFLDIAATVSTRATCTRKCVGAVIVKDKCILSTGYNGSVRGSPHCTDDGCLMDNGHCIRCVHAEVNAVIQAAKHGVSIDGATAYITVNPCLNCYKVLVNAGIKEIIYRDMYAAVDYDILNIPQMYEPLVVQVKKEE